VLRSDRGSLFVVCSCCERERVVFGVVVNPDGRSFRVRDEGFRFDWLSSHESDVLWDSPHTAHATCRFAFVLFTPKSLATAGYNRLNIWRNELTHGTLAPRNKAFRNQCPGKIDTQDVCQPLAGQMAAPAYNDCIQPAYKL
jgi:hypothetical protein